MAFTLFGQNPASGQQPASSTPAQGQPAQSQQAQPTPAQSAQPAQSQQQAQPAQPTQSEQPAQQRVGVFDMLRNFTNPQQPAQTPADNTATDIFGQPVQQAQPQGDIGAVLAALMNADELNTMSSAPSINLDRLTETLPSLGLSDGIDFAAIEQQMQNGQTGDALRAVVNSTQTNTIRAIVPIINELMQHAVQAASTAAVTTSQHDLMSSAIVSEFQQRYPYGSSGAIMPLLTQFANALAQNAPRGAKPSDIADQLHQLFQGVGSSTQQPTNQNNQRGVQTSFSDLFSN